MTVPETFEAFENAPLYIARLFEKGIFEIWNGYMLQSLCL
jgi:hypothetical protein